MVKSFYSKLIVLLFFLAVLISCNKSDKHPAATAPDLKWTFSTINNDGVASSISRDSQDTMHISYYGTNDAVQYVSNATGTWSSSTVDTTIGNVAGNVSTAITVDSLDAVHISYGSYTRKQLLYATVSAGTWTTSIVDSANIRHTSIATDSNNNVHIGYYDQTTGAYKYATTNAIGSWVTTTIDTAYFTEGFCSLVVDSNDKVHVAYIGSNAGSSTDVMYATNALGTWTTSAIIPGGADSSSGVGLARDSHDKMHITYYGAGNAGLMHATNASGAWATAVIDDWAYAGYISSIAIGPHDTLHVAYSYFGADGNYLMYATLSDGIWWSWPIDYVGVAGFDCSITADSHDRPHISYWDGYLPYQGLTYATAQ